MQLLCSFFSMSKGLLTNKIFIKAMFMLIKTMFHNASILHIHLCKWICRIDIK